MQNLFGRVVALRVLAGLFRAIRRQICNTDLSGCNIRPVGKNTAFKFRLFSATLNRESSFFRTTRGVSIRRCPVFVNQDGSELGGASIRRDPLFANPEGSNVANPEGSFFANLVESHLGRVLFLQSGRILFLPIRKNPTFVNLEGPIIRSGPFLSIGRGPRKIYNF